MDIPAESIHEAASQGDVRTVRALLANNPTEIDARGKYKQTPLHFAAEEGHANVVELLLKLGATIDAENSVGHTPLFLAALGGHADAATILVSRGANLKATTGVRRMCSLQMA